MRIIPAIDILNGKCVRLTKGDYDTQKIYSNSPLEVAKEFEAHGMRYLHIVDLDGARSHEIVNHEVLYEIASQTNLIIDFGGGIKKESDLETAFQCGASQVTVGSMAVKNPLLFMEWLQKYGADKILLGADCKNRKIMSMGWNEDSGSDVVDFITDYAKQGVRNVICTDVGKDGMLSGPATKLYKEILCVSQINLIASGGISNTNDISTIRDTGCEGVIIGKAIYEGRITLKELSGLC
jgi:phosphoribosylformimino-5-aminoimidazole carboxamide ribotide isomerase